jgi:hypothetical protein
MICTWYLLFGHENLYIGIYCKGSCMHMWLWVSKKNLPSQVGTWFYNDMTIWHEVTKMTNGCHFDHFMLNSHAILIHCFYLCLLYSLVENMIKKNRNHVPLWFFWPPWSAVSKRLHICFFGFTSAILKFRGHVIHHWKDIFKTFLAVY